MQFAVGINFRSSFGEYQGAQLLDIMMEEDLVFKEISKLSSKVM